MKNTIFPFALTALLLGAAACNVEKTGKDSYKVETVDTRSKADQVRTNATEAGKDLKEEAKKLGDQISTGAHDVAASDAAQSAKAGAKALGESIKQGAQDVASSDAAQRVKNGAKEMGQGVKQGAGEVTQATGEKIQKAGAKMTEETKTTTRH